MKLETHAVVDQHGDFVNVGYFHDLGDDEGWDGLLIGPHDVLLNVIKEYLGSDGDTYRVVPLEIPSPAEAS